MSKVYWVAGAFALVFAATMVPFLGAVALGPLAAFAVAMVAGFWVAHYTGAGLGPATGLGAVIGVGALVAATAAFALYGFGIGTDPAVQEFVRASEPNVEARIPYEWMPALGAATGALVGFLAGGVNLMLAALGGLIGGLIGGQAPVAQQPHAR
jgi:hypothetical protein